MYLIRMSYAAETYPLVFTGGGDLLGFGSAQMVPSAGAGETVEQVIELEFGGTPANIETGVRLVGQFLTHAARQAAKPAAAQVYLEAQVSSTTAIYRSPVLSGWLELGQAGADQRALGTQAGRLHLVRANWWEALSEVTLVNAQAITNHRDAGHSNVVTVAADAGELDLPARARVVVALTTAVTAPAALLVGEWMGAPGDLDLFFEGADGAARGGITNSNTVDAGSSNGGYLNLGWNGAAETALWQVDISAALLALAAGKPYRVIARLGDGIVTTASERVWARWAIVYVDAGSVERTLYESPGAYWPTLQELILGPVLYLPPWVVNGTAPALRVILKATCPGAGAHAIKLDFVDFCPLDGWRYYDPALQSYGLSVNDYGQPGMAGPAGGVMTHAIEGPGFMLEPGWSKQFQFYFALKEAAEVSASANLAGTVSVYYRPRRRML